MERFLVAIIGLSLVLGLCAGAMAQDMQLWCAPATQKVFKDTPACDMADCGLYITAAGGEYESVQLVITPNEDLSNVTVSAAADDVKVYEVRYVSIPHTPEKQWPDPLPPHLRPVNLKAGQNQPFWIKVYVPEYQSPGLYWTTVHVDVDGRQAAVIPLTVSVYPFTISKTPHVRTAFGISKGYLYNHHEVSPKMQAREFLYARYYEMLLDHRVSAYSVPFGVTSPRAMKYLRDERMTSYVIPYTDDRDEMLETCRYLGEKGVFHKGMYYPIDEPFTKKSYDTLQQRAQNIHDTTVTGKVCSPFYRGPDFDSERDIFDIATDWLDIWCMNTGYYGATQMEKMQERQAAGEEAWWYVCCGPGRPKANFFVDMNAMQHRMLFWQMYKHNIDGLLYWSTTYWNPSVTKDPWEDMATVKDINPKLYGDGSLMYPGSKIGVNSPVSSIRLECILDGLEDIEYLVLLERAYGREVADKMVASLVTSLTEYSQDPLELLTVREDIADGLSALRAFEATQELEGVGTEAELSSGTGKDAGPYVSR